LAEEKIPSIYEGLHQKLGGFPVGDFVRAYAKAYFEAEVKTIRKLRELLGVSSEYKGFARCSLLCRASEVRLFRAGGREHGVELCCLRDTFTGAGKITLARSGLRKNLALSGMV
jgi:hypothetical protein